MKHSEGFLRLVNDAKTRIKEVTVSDTKERMKQNPAAKLIDVREDNEWDSAHAAGAIHLGKGIIERDIETTVPDKSTELILYCGGGYRSALAADALEKIGYKNSSRWLGDGRPGVTVVERSQTENLRTPTCCPTNFSLSCVDPLLIQSHQRQTKVRRT